MHNSFGFLSDLSCLEIVSIIKANPNTAFAAIIEPDSLPNLVTNANLATCQASAAGYEEGVAYALRSLGALPNVVQYVDAGHGGWLGWNDNLGKLVGDMQSLIHTDGILSSWS